MAEAEDVLNDIARHATVYTRKLWRRHYPQEEIPYLYLSDVANRLDLLLLSAFGQHFSIRVAQPPVPPTLLARVFRRSPSPFCVQAIPATDGMTIWLPTRSSFTDAVVAREWFRITALQQAMRATRNSAAYNAQLPHPVARDIYLLIESFAADEQLVQRFPGLRPHIDHLRRTALAQRPPLSAFGPARRALELFYQKILQQPCGAGTEFLPPCASPAQSVAATYNLLPTLMELAPTYSEQSYGIAPLLKDIWSGELRAPADKVSVTALDVEEAAKEHDNPKSARLPRRPDVREPGEDEDKENKKDDAWVVQGDESHPKAEDPMGLQRPVDREENNAEEYADLVAELSEARLVSTPGQSREILIADDAPDKRSQVNHRMAATTTELNYPEWDYQQEAYRHPGATVCVSQMPYGAPEWVAQTLKHYQSLIYGIQRQFELLRARRIVYRQQMDGEEIDIDAYVENYADFRAGDTFNQALYQTRRVTEKNVAITLLVDISGSTDAWIANNRRIIDIEREALLLVAIALQSLGEPYSILAFSGEGPNAVAVREVKHASEQYSQDVALRISALQPERFTRAGAAVRHATADIMRMNAAHRLLIVLSDGKPNDNDDYEGRYGIEDTRQAVTEAKNQGIQLFCLTIDRQAASYLPLIFGANHYALLPHPDQLPRVLLDWIKRLLRS